MSPATFADNSVVKYPDATPGETLSYAKTFSVDVSPGTDGDLFVYILPFVECPLATYSASSGWKFYCDPNMNSPTWMADNAIYGFRCLGQSATCYNTTAEVYKQGNVNAAVLRSCVDRHRIHRAITSSNAATSFNLEIVDMVNIDGIPMSVAEITSNSKHPYIGRASEGCYVVNRNFGGFDWIFRNGPENKASTTEYHMMYSTTIGSASPQTASTAGSSVVRSFLAMPSSVTAAPNSYSCPSSTITAGTNSYATQNVLLSSMNSWETISKSLGVSGFQGNNYGVAVVGFTGLSTQTSITVKFKHMYEFLLKPSSPFTPLTSPSWAKAEWVRNVIRKQLMDKQDAFNADANFFGAILKGLKTLWPAVAPVIGKGLSSLGNFLIAKGSSDQSAKQTAQNAEMVSPSRIPAARKTAARRQKAAARAGAQVVRVSVSKRKKKRSGSAAQQPFSGSKTESGIYILKPK